MGYNKQIYRQNLRSAKIQDGGGKVHSQLSAGSLVCGFSCPRFHPNNANPNSNPNPNPIPKTLTLNLALTLTRDT